jgi:transcription elongation factor GreA-like protein
MDLPKITQLVENDDVDAVEIEWMSAIETGESTQAMCETLKLLVDAKKPDIALMLASMLLTNASEKQTPAEALDIARHILPILPANPELRTAMAKLYRQLHSETEHFDLFMDESGLESNQAPRRAIRTLDTCLSLKPGSTLAGRYENNVLRVDGFNDIMGTFDLTEPGGRQTSLEPKLLADNYELVDDDDFRVMRAFRPDDLTELVASDPTAVMIGVCRMNGGQIESLELRDTIAPKYLPQKKWSNWWTRAKTAVKRSPFLTIEGRNPTFVIYHPDGHSLEQELEASVDAARVPLELLNVLKITADGRVASWVLSREIIEKHDLKPWDNEGLIDIIRAIKGVIVAVFFEEMGNNRVRISCRSKSPDADVSRMCGKFNGGGHRLAAGARAVGPVEEIERKFLKTVYDGIEGRY